MSGDKNKPAKRALRSESTETSQFFSLGPDKQPMAEANTIQKYKEKITDCQSQITQLTEQAKAAEKKFNTQIKNLKTDNDELHTESNKCKGKIKNLENQIDIFRDSERNLKSQINKIQSENESLKKNLNSSNQQVDISSDIESNYKSQIDSLQSENTGLTKQIETLRNTLLEKNLQFKNNTASKFSQSTEIQPNNNTISIPTPTLAMAITLRDAIHGIPIFKGEVKELDSFLNTCESYIALVDNANSANLLSIIKTKISGEAYNKIQPISELNTWELLKARLKSKIKKHVTFEFAQQDLANIRQNKSDTVEKYGDRIKEKLRELNEASRKLSNDNNQLAVLFTANEKMAISKFEQNLNNESLRLLVSAANKSSLDECVLYAMQRDLIQSDFKKEKCGFCSIPGHTEDKCRKKQASEKNRFSASTNANFSSASGSSSSSFDQNKRNFNNYSKNPRNAQYNNGNGNGNGKNSNGQGNNTNNDYKPNKNWTKPSTFQTKSVQKIESKTAIEDSIHDDDSITLKDLFSELNTKN